MRVSARRRAPAADLGVDRRRRPTVHARGGVADREAAVAPRRVTNVDRLTGHRERRLLRGQSRVAPATRHGGQHLRFGSIAALQPEGAERGNAFDLVVGQLENGCRRQSLDEIGGGVAGEEARMTQRRHEEVAVRRDACQVEPFEREREPSRRLGASRCVSDHLGQHRIEVDTDDRPGLDTTFPADRRRRCRLERGEGARRREESGRGVFGVEAYLDRRAARRARRSARSRAARPWRRAAAREPRRCRSPPPSPGARPAAWCSPPGRRTHASRRRRGTRPCPPSSSRSPCPAAGRPRRWRRAWWRRRSVTALPRRSSDDVAGSSTRVRRGARGCRRCRRGVGSRCGAPGVRSARGTPDRHRTRRPLRVAPLPPHPPASAAESTMRIPLPPPPAAALTSTGNPTLVGVGRIIRRGKRGHAGVDRGALRRQLVAHGGDRVRRRTDPYESGRDDRFGEVGVLR